MKADKELDARIAEEVMGWKRMSWKDYHAHMNFMGTDERREFTYAWHDADGNMTEFHATDVLYYDDPTPAWSPSEEIADAWLVVEKLGFSIWCAGGPDKYKWGAGYWDWEDGKQDILVYKLDNTPTSERLSPITATAPLAICLAALKAIKD